MYGGNHSDVFRNEIGYSVIECTDGGYAFAGIRHGIWQSGFYTENIWYANETLAFANSEDFWLLKTDSQGYHQWNVTFGRVRLVPIPDPPFLGIKGDVETCHSLIECATGGYLLVGETDSQAGHKIWIIRTDATGNELWNRTIGSGSLDPDYRGVDVIECENGDFLILGDFEFSSDPGYDGIILLRTDSDGYQIWNKTYTSPSEHYYAVDIERHFDGSLAILGAKGPYNSGRDFWLLWTNENGVQLWNQTIGGNELDNPQALDITVLGGPAPSIGFAMVGETRSYGGSDPDWWLVVANSTGHPLWNRTYGGDSEDRMGGIISKGNLGFAMVGMTTNYGPNYQGTFAFEKANVWVVRTNASGDIEWDHTFGGAGADTATTITLCDDGSFIIVGATENSATGHSDAMLIWMTDEQPPLLPPNIFDIPGFPWSSILITLVVTLGILMVYRSRKRKK
jgi:hypothetical protein